ncbi:MAG: c-type cytochrome [Acidimicrobiia bacterium]|nr:c-type cytochrome [Acidimicrobiia bacterium]
MARWLRSSDEIADGFPAPPRSRRGEAAFLLMLALVVGLGFTLFAPSAEAKQKFLSGFSQAYPAAAGTPLDSCLLCHTDPVHPGEDNLNQYGQDWEDGDYGDKDYLAPALVNRDSDGDGVPNGIEIRQLSLPGDPSSSTPPTTTTTLPGAPPDGRGLYAARCAACHGPNGGNLNGTSLGRSAFITITLNGQGGMPAQSGLTGEEVGAIWDYVTGAVPSPTTTTQPGATTTTIQPAGGATVWAQNCAGCHGAKGGNVVPTSLSKAQLVSIVNNGKGTMPAFAWLGSAQVNNVANYMLSLSLPPTTLPGATTTTTSPRSGASIYAASCALCHGADGGNLRGHTLSLSQIDSITTSGTGTMSGFSGRLSAAEISNVSQYVASVGSSSGLTTTTAVPGSALSGANLYMQNCSGCHGLHGEGGPGGAVAGTTLSRSQLISVITAGTSGMPGYASQLSAEEITAIADHLLGVSGGGTATGGEPASGGIPLPPELVEGHSLYGRFCAACHGADGGGGLGGPVAGIGLTAGELDDIIRNGAGSMPGFADQMTDEQLVSLVLFTEALASGRQFQAAETTTTTDPTAIQGADSGPQALGAAQPDDSDSNSPIPVIVVSLLAGLVAAGAAVVWARLGRKLTA